ncbi:MAG TPA: HDIG domain-containing protein [Euryarchaeota archaeon]|nr:HDIG domain-containing protein [Euryarchaeota archaeon]
MREYVIEAFPEVQQIKDDKLREGTITCWAEAMTAGGWDKLDDIPFTLLISDPSASLLEHTRRVTRQAIAVANVRGDLDMDLVISGGLLHDVGKLLEYDRVDGKVVKSNYGNLVRHPVSGAGLAMKHGLPDEIVHIIAGHSKEGEMVKRIPEAILINHCDFIDFEIAKAK